MHRSTGHSVNWLQWANQCLSQAAFVWAIVIASHIALGDTQLRVTTDDDLRKLPDDLVSLSLRGSPGYGMDQVTDDGIEHLPRLKRLRILHAGALGLTDRSLAHISKLGELEDLSLDSNQITGTGLEHLKALKKLRKLNLSFNPLTNDACEVLSHLTSLTELHLQLPQPIDDQLLERCAKLHRLEKLVLNEQARGVTNKGLADIGKLSRLKNLSLNGARIDAEGLRSIRSMKQLEQLRLSTLQDVPPGSLTWLSELAALRVLEVAQVRLNERDLE